MHELLITATKASEGSALQVSVTDTITPLPDAVACWGPTAGLPDRTVLIVESLVSVAST